MEKLSKKKMEIYGKIYYTMDKDHPDWNCVIGEKSESRIHEFDDTYRFDPELYTKADAIRYMKNDLSLIAGGGYNRKHIHNVKFVFEMEPSIVKELENLIKNNLEKFQN